MSPTRNEQYVVKFHPVFWFWAGLSMFCFAVRLPTAFLKNSFTAIAYKAPGNNLICCCTTIKLTRLHITRSGATTIVLISIVLGYIIFFRSSSLVKNIEVVFHLNEFEVLLYSQEQLGCLPLKKNVDCFHLEKLR